MSAFSSRTGLYKAGVFLLFAMIVVFLVGFGAPYWAKVDYLQSNYITYTYHEGLWMLCITADLSSTTVTATVSGCHNYGVSGFPAWFHIARLMEGVCLVGLCIAGVYALATNCCRTFPGPRTRVLEVLAGISGLVGFTGCMIYVGMRKEKDVGSHDGLNVYLAIFFLGLDWDFFWAFYLATVASALAVVAAIMVGVGNKPVETPPISSGVVMTTYPAQPAQPGYAGQPYVVQPGYAVHQPGHPGYAPPPKAGYPNA